MKRYPNKTIFSPQDVIKFLDSPFALWKDKEAAINGKSNKEKEKKEERKRLQDELFEEGNLFEEKVITNIIKDLPDAKIFEIEKDENGNIITQNKKEQTIQAMKDGSSVIVQAYLEDENLYGFADVLFKVDTPSKLGNYSYVVKDIKRSQTPKAKFILQILTYCEILSKIQGVYPEKAYIILGSGEEEEFKTSDYKDYFNQIINSCSEFLNTEQDMPFPERDQNHGLWQEYADDLLSERNDISLLPDISKDQIKVLRENGIDSIDKLVVAETDILSAEILNRLKIQSSIYLSVKPKNKDEEEKDKKVVFEFYQHSKENPKGLNNLPKRTRKDIYIDLKFSDSLSKEGFVFLANYRYFTEEGKIKTETFVARGKKEEESLIKSLLDVIKNRINEDGSVLGNVYFYGKTVLDNLINACSYYDLELSFLNTLIYFDKLIDLQSILKQSIALNAKSISFDDVANTICEDGFFVDDPESVLFSIILHSFNEELKLKASDSFKKLNNKRMSALIDIHSWLLERQKEKEDLFYISFKDREEGLLSSVIEQERQEKAAKEVLKKDNEEESEDEISSNVILGDFSYSEKEYLNAPIEKKIETLVKQFGKYHNHEKFPNLLTKKTILKADDLYLDAEPLTLSNLELKEENEALFTYTFPKQETKIDIGDKVCIKQNSSLNATVYSLDIEKREVVLKYPKKRIPFALKLSRITIIIDNELPDKMIKDKILKNIKESTSENGELNKAMNDFLFRRYPDVIGVVKGEDLYNEEEDLIEAAKRVVKNMNNTSLIFQGPPGAGKTHTTVEIIKSLLESGKKIAISSNSHKAINNVLEKIKERFPETKILKQQSAPDEELIKKGIKFPDKKGNSAKDFEVVGGTVYAFVKDEFDGFFDYLFIDEAGQVSLANLFAMNKCAKNIILIGDQMQLEQPTQAIHPGDSGQSILEYFLNEYKTIPKSYGFFLPITRRMNPSLTKIISENFYEGKLKSHSSTDNNKLILKDTKIINKKTGLQYISVEHKDNIIYSLEEVSKIKEITEELLTQSVEINGIIRPIKMDDIIFVSPYNMQVKKIKEMIPGANAGSVDLFQGQEAPIVIISLASSQAGGRGIEFLLSENRMNVAISRGKCLAILVASPSIANSPVNSLNELKLINMFCKLINS